MRLYACSAPTLGRRVAAGDREHLGELPAAEAVEAVVQHDGEICVAGYHLKSIADPEWLRVERHLQLPVLCRHPLELDPRAPEDAGHSASSPG